MGSIGLSNSTVRSPAAPSARRPCTASAHVPPAPRGRRVPLPPHPQRLFPRPRPAGASFAPASSSPPKPRSQSMPRNVRIDDLFRLILPSQPALSPDGARVVFVVKRLNAKENRHTSHLWIATSKGGRPRQLTRGLVSTEARRGAPTARSWRSSRPRRESQPVGSCRSKAVSRASSPITAAARSRIWCGRPTAASWRTRSSPCRRNPRTRRRRRRRSSTSRGSTTRKTASAGSVTSGGPSATKRTHRPGASRHSRRARTTTPSRSGARKQAHRVRVAARKNAESTPDLTSPLRDGPARRDCAS